MKKFLSIALTLALLLMLCACGGDSIIGKWQFADVNTYEFEKDNTVTISIATVINYEGTYEIEGDKIIITLPASLLMPNGITFELTYSVDGDTLTLEGDSMFNGVSMKTEYTRVEE